MNMLGRIVLLSIFAACGAGAAVYLSTSNDLSSRIALSFFQPPATPQVASAGPAAVGPAAVGSAAVETAADTGEDFVEAGQAEVQAPRIERESANPLGSGPADPTPTTAWPGPVRNGSASGAVRRTPPAGPLAAQPATPHSIPARPIGLSPNPAVEMPLAAAGEPVVATLRPAVRQQVEVDKSEPSLPVSTMMQLLDKVLERRQREDDRQIARQSTTTDPSQRRLPELAPPATPSSHKEVIHAGQDRLSLQLKDIDIREVLELLSRGSGRNIVATKSVQGTVTGTMQDVSFETALRGILKSTGYVDHREAEIIYVGLPEEFKTEPAEVEQIVTRIFRPNYIRASDLQALITPLLTPSLGTVSVTAPAESGIGADSANAGGDNYADAEVVLVRDYVSVLQEIDRVFRDVDVRPLQVAIEAMILSVKLNDSNQLGVDFELLKDHDDVRIISGNPPLSLGQLNFSDGGLKVGILNSSISFLLDALETVGDTDVIATPRLLVLNKQRAEILIGAELGYVSSTVTETATTQSVEFLEVGTQLRIRPFISNDGLVRMEIHPELSTGSVRVEGGFTLPDKEVTEVTTNIIAYDGSTVIIGGLIRDDISSNSTQIPLLGSLPAVGPLFRQKSETLDRREILVVITPHIVGDTELTQEGNHAAMEFHHRHAVQFEKLSPLAKRRIAHNYFLKAQRAWALGEAERALKYVNLAIHYNPQSRAAIDLRADIFSGIPLGDHAAGAEYIAPQPAADGSEVHDWLPDPIDPATGALQPLPASDDAVSASRLQVGSPTP